MNILFLTIQLPDLGSNDGGFYGDIIKELSYNGHKITAIAPALAKQETGVYREGDITVLRVKLIPFIANLPTYKKILGVLLMNPLYIRAYKKYLYNEKYDWIIMPTPPSSLIDVVLEIKKQTKSKLYILLRDIHPESKKRLPTKETLSRNDVYEECKKPYCVNWLMYKYLFIKSQKGYKNADLIGCMSPSNISFVKNIAPYLKDEKIVLLPNWYKEIKNTVVTVSPDSILMKYGLSKKFIAIFGGTIGEGQAVWNIATLAKRFKSYNDIVFLIVGRGVKMSVLKKMAYNDNLKNMVFMNYMPRKEYEILLASADLGLITIDEKYTVPTCPSKVIGYMALKKPVCAMFNRNSDYGDFYIGKAKCGLWSTDLDNEKMFSNFEWFYTHPKERKEMGLNGYNYFKEHFSVEVICKEFCRQLEKY